ncbi:tyrosine-protein kinase receptor Tie-2-like [Saccostrea cucullata]|uniref:tyrosine-protein kinase receptor Tie-2-like n=1 Tax=Saccostrea cuccullata TaxID=36930 RepID=UPI002ED0F83A
MQIYIYLVFLSIVTIFGYDDLSTNKSASQSSTGVCSPPCTATTAVDGNVQTCMKTLDIGGSSPLKSVWWYVDLGDIKSIYGIRIQFQDYGADNRTMIMRQQGRFAGFSLYVSNSTKKENGYRCYKDGPELPPLDFNTTCVTQGRFVIFYNERLKGITYPTGYQTSNVFTELCEVTVTGCKHPSIYGFGCDLSCPENCQERRCYIVNGSCLGCRPGWIGEFCNNSCPAGFYGLECRIPCIGQCRDSKPCNHNTGDCDEGCADGWTGTECSKQCPAETYGPDCIYNCSGHCVNGVSCNRTTGSCNSGCKPGCTGEHCDKACSIGFYGLNCTKQCNNHCRHGINHCNHQDGHCDLGCQDGFIGLICNESEFFNAVFFFTLAISYLGHF